MKVPVVGSCLAKPGKDGGGGGGGADAASTLPISFDWFFSNSLSDLAGEHTLTTDSITTLKF